MMEEDENGIVTFKLTRDKAKVLNEMIKEREAYNLITSKLKNLWIYGFIAGVAILWAFGEKIQGLFIKV